MYFNYYTRIAQTRWERYSFLRGWWHVYADDPRWTPPYYPGLRRTLQSTQDPHLTRMSAAMLYVEAIPGRWSNSGTGGTYSAGIMEETVGATIIHCDPRRQDATAYLALLRVVNDEECLERLMGSVMEHLWQRGVRRVIGPTGLSPHLQSGVLQDHFHQLPPLHTPYNPPYLPEVISSMMRPLIESRLYHTTIPAQNLIIQDHHGDPKPWQRGPAQLFPLAPRRLAKSLLPLLSEACASWSHWPPLDSQEALFLLRQLEPWPLCGWLAYINRNPVGFVLLQPDLTASLRLAKGGRNPLWRPWLAWRARRPASAGRLLFGAVLPEWQRQGDRHSTVAAGTSHGSTPGMADANRWSCTC
ncbi:hypothetical protein KFU94_01225 [Chloroflexi bacterium TSY]|nr:hypothetical protein [Chloroflexi bacterium TSY]